MTKSIQKANLNQFKVLTEEKNNTKQFEFIIKDDKLVNIKFYYPNGELLNETCLANGRIISYKIYKETYVNNTGFSMSNKIVSRLKYELNLDKYDNLNFYQTYEQNTGKKMYEGGCLNGKKSGFGTEFYTSGNIKYHGFWLDDHMHDHGTLYYDNANTKYSGRFVRGKRDGFGISYYENGNKKYDGTWKNDKMNDDNKAFYDNGGLCMQGTFSDEYFNGTCFAHDGKKFYEGEMIFNIQENFWMKNGFGNLYYSNGVSQYNGEWTNNKFDGNGTLNHNNSNPKYIGNFKDNLFSGYGAKYDFCGVLIVMGKWASNELESINLTDEHLLKGYKIVDFGDKLFIGEINNGVRNGYGEWYQKTTGFKYFEGCSNNPNTSGLCKQYYKTKFDHRVLQHIGYKFKNQWHGQSYNYYENGKFQARVSCSQDNLVTDKFRLQYKKNGEIDFINSYKYVISYDVVL